MSVCSVTVGPGGRLLIESRRLHMMHWCPEHVMQSIRAVHITGHIMYSVDSEKVYYKSGGRRSLHSRHPSIPETLYSTATVPVQYETPAVLRGKSAPLPIVLPVRSSVENYRRATYACGSRGAMASISTSSHVCLSQYDYSNEVTEGKRGGRGRNLESDRGLTMQRQRIGGCCYTLNHAYRPPPR
jgi:hypothetical protein